MLFRNEKAALSGYHAWRRGQLETAVKELESALTANPCALDVIYPLARALHEKGDTAAALRLLDDIPEQSSAGGGSLHRTIIHYDRGDESELRECVERMGDDNPIAGALEELFRARKEERTPHLEPSTLWNAEIAARLLTLLEERFAAVVKSRDDAFHHKLFAPAPAPGSDKAAGTGGAVRKPSTRDEWAAALEAAFAGKEFDRVVRLWGRSGTHDDWKKDISAVVYRTYAAYAIEPPGDAVEQVRAALAGLPTSVDLHFLDGLCSVRAGAPVRASHAFARAARIADTEIHAVIQGVAKELQVEI